MHVCLQMDSLSSLDTVTDSTLFLAKEALHRGWRVTYFTPDQLSLVTTSATPPHLMAWGHDLYHDDRNLWHQGPRLRLNLSLAPDTPDFLLVRQNPPFDMGYITSTYLLDLLPSKVRVQSPPKALRDLPEKIIPFHLSPLMPPTLVTQSLSEARSFVADHGPCVIKPLYLFGGQGIQKITTPDQLTSMEAFQLSTEETPGSLPEKLPLILQAYLPSIEREGDKRLFIIGGKVVGWFRRQPSHGEFRTNMHLGGEAKVCDLTPAELAIGKAVGQLLTRHGVLLAGLDIAEEKLLEVNITCPTGLAALNKLSGCNLAPTYWDEMLSAAPIPSKNPF